MKEALACEWDLRVFQDGDTELAKKLKEDYGELLASAIQNPNTLDEPVDDQAHARTGEQPTNPSANNLPQDPWYSPAREARRGANVIQDTSGRDQPEAALQWGSITLQSNQPKVTEGPESGLAQQCEAGHARVISNQYPGQEVNFQPGTDGMGREPAFGQIPHQDPQGVMRQRVYNEAIGAATGNQQIEQFTGNEQLLFSARANAFHSDIGGIETLLPDLSNEEMFGLFNSLFPPTTLV